MIIDRLYTPSLAQVAYLVADDSTGDVAVIDPRRDVQSALDWAAERGFRITSIFETHVHADFVSGGPELARLTGAPLHTSRLGHQEFPHHPLDDGDVVSVGNLTIQALWTPGHTPEHMSYLLFDPARGETPVALFSGDALFVGDVGRPDLLGASHTTELAEQLHATVSERFMSLPDEVVVYPGHTAGSSCGKQIGDAPDTTIGAEKRMNYAFKPMDREKFVATVLKDMPLAPTYYPELKKVNKVGPVSIATLPEIAPLSPAKVDAMLSANALVIDTRSAAEFGDGHIPGVLAVGWGSNFLTWMGWIAPYDRDLVLVLDDATSHDEVALELRRIGIDRVSGYLEGGMAAWREAGLPVATMPQISVSELAQRLTETGSALAVLDVRRPDEWDEGHITSARHAYAGELTQGADAPVDDSRPTAVVCGSGYRSAVAASLLAQRGHANLLNVTGGMTAWNEAGLPVVR